MELTAFYPWRMTALERQPTAAAATDTDADDVARFQAGDSSAFDSLVRRREREVYQVAWRTLGDPEDAKEAAQETFLRAFRALGRFRGEATFRTWVIGIAINVCRNRAAMAEEKVRRRSRSTEPDDPDDPAEGFPVADPAPGPERAALGGELKEALGKALLALPREHREILVLREVQGMEYEELAAALEVPVGTVKSRLCRARQALREHLQGVWP